MAKIPEVNIASFWNLTNEELPESALSGRIILVEESNDMYVGVGLDAPLLKVSDIQIIESIDELEEKDNTLSILYILNSTSELYIFNHGVPEKCNGLGLTGVYNLYTELPTSNVIDGLFCVLKDETNNNRTTMYAYSGGFYIRLQYTDFDINTFYQFKIGNTFIAAKNANNTLTINTDNTFYTSASDGKIYINQKAQSLNVLKREQYTGFTSGQLQVFPANVMVVYTAIAKNELFALGYSGASGSSFVNNIYKYDKVNGWILLKSDEIPYSGGVMYTLITYNDKIYICGGYSLTSTKASYNTLYEFDPDTLSFIQKSSMNTGRWGFGYGVIGNKLYIAGGLDSYNGTVLRTIEYYDFDNDTWTLLPNEYNTPILFYRGSSFAIGNELHLLNSASLASHYVFNTDTLTYKQKSVTPFDGYFARIIKTTSNTIFAFKSGIIYSYSIEEDNWVKVGSMIRNKSTPYICIDNDNIVYHVGHYEVSSIAKEFECVQIIHKDVTNDCQIVVRLPVNGNILYNNDYSKNITIPKNGYMEYVVAGNNNKDLDVIIQEFKYN